jgi:hypothetical protein
VERSSFEQKKLKLDVAVRRTLSGKQHDPRFKRNDPLDERKKSMNPFWLVAMSGRVHRNDPITRAAQSGGHRS